MTKDLYLNLISKGTIGGDKRKIEILETDIVEHNASVKAILTGNDHRFTTYLMLVENSDGEWKVINDMPYVEKLYV